jgi:hypothetical protein
LGVLPLKVAERNYGSGILRLEYVVGVDYDDDLVDMAD